MLSLFDLEFDQDEALSCPYIARRINPGEIEDFQVFGERNSGTNFTASLIASNTSLAERNVYGWKHGYPVSTAYRPSSLIVYVFRHPIDWAVSMYNSPYAVCSFVKMDSFSTFIRSEWGSFLRSQSNTKWRKRWNATIVGGVDGRECVFDRHPVSGKRFSSIFEMRQWKLITGLLMVNRECNFVAVPYEAIKENRKEFIEFISRFFGTRLKKEFDPIPNKVSPSVRRKRPFFSKEQISRRDLDWIFSCLDLEFESKLGYELKL